LKECILKCLCANCSCCCSGETVQDFRRKHILVRSVRARISFFVFTYSESLSLSRILHSQ
jgi:hypothetical protein